MSGSGNDDDKTMFLPSALPPAFPEATRPAPPAAPPQPAGNDAPPPATAPAGRNHLLTAAGPVLALAQGIRTGRLRMALPQFHREATQAITDFDRAIQPAVSEATRQRARYALCATVDDIAQNLPDHGDAAEWARRTMVASFFKDDAGERFGQLVDDALRAPAGNLDLIELYHACLAAGYEGQFRAIPDGKRLLREIMARLHAALPQTPTPPASATAPLEQAAPAPLSASRFRSKAALAGGAAVALLLAGLVATRLLAPGDRVPSKPLAAVSHPIRSQPPQVSAAAPPPPSQPVVAPTAVGGAAPAQPAAAVATGPVADAYAHTVLPACKRVTQDHYPFFGGAAQDTSVADATRLFGSGGTLDAFVQQRLTPLLAIAGPVWRWKSDPATASLDPQSPEQFAKAAAIRDLLAGGLALRVSVAGFGSDVGAAEIASGGTSTRFGEGGEAKPLRWSATGTPGAEVVLYGNAGAQAEVARFTTAGPWALFRLIDKAARESSGTQAFKATFGEGARSATLLIELPGNRNPFSRGGLWSFRCPVAL